MDSIAKQGVRCPICGDKKNMEIKFNKDKRILEFMETENIKDDYHWYLCKKCGNGYQHPETDLRLTNYLWNNSRAELTQENIGDKSKKELKAGEVIYGVYKSSLAGKRSVLDVGCGYGGLIKVLQENGFQVTGIDLDPTTKKMHEYFGLDTKIGAIEELLPDQKFDVLFSNYAIYFITDVKKFLISLRDKLTPEGILCLSSADFYSCLACSEPGLAHSFYPSKHSLVYLLEEVGFRIKMVKSSKSCIYIVATPTMSGHNRHRDVGASNSRKTLFLYRTRGIRHTLVGKPLLLAYRLKHKIIKQ